jgi:hypothetical protein
MALKEKHAWRRRLGLRGSLWYFEEPKKPKPPSVFSQPAAWSAFVAAISAVLTAIFAYNNYLFTKQSYMQTHPPKLIATLAQIDHGDGGWTYSVMVRNDGNTEALNIYARLVFGGTTHDARFVDLFDNGMPAGSIHTLSGPPGNRGPEKDGDLVVVTLTYEDRIGKSDFDFNNSAREDKFCGILKESYAMLGGCDAVLSGYQEKSAPKSAK